MSRESYETDRLLDLERPDLQSQTRTLDELVRLAELRLEEIERAFKAHLIEHKRGNENANASTKPREL